MTRVLILAATASSINFILSLKDRPDIQLFITDANRYASGLYYPWVTPFIVPRASNLEYYRKALDEIVREHAIDLLIPSSDEDIHATTRLLAEGWNPPVKMFRADYRTLVAMVHKDLVMEKLKGLDGMDIPETYSRIKDVRYPAVAKPQRGGGAKGVSVVNSETELIKQNEVIEKYFGGGPVWQEFIPGETGSIYVVLLLYGQDGRVYGEVVSRSSLTALPWGGGGNAGTMETVPELLDSSKTIINHLGGWAGPINLEFKRHSGNGRFYLMEINCRMNGYSYLYTMNGMNFPAAVIDLLRNGSIDPLTPPENPRTNFILGFRERLVDSWF